ncbi:hypothetical protein CPB83DRAFT_855979 [Crepidotus variabilis]|uniref:F-box domain-containing protein n=1 Tax=Crepidotus variabilis TaxID=179855 RepID=A0A9P6EDQ1_9AGAR|nr:hypothetical protein CPB83DRAFT_855979 [Crepidotus variabilis]
MASFDLRARSPFSSRLRTTFIPNDVDTCLAKSIIRQESLRIAELEKEITRVKGLYDGLKMQYSQISDFIRDHRRMIHPVRRGLPDDILQEIFLHCVSTGRFIALHSSVPPLSLTAVCTSWRRVARSTPRLWASLHIPIFDQVNWRLDSPTWGFLSAEQAQAQLKCRASVVQQWLTLAKRKPLNLALPAPDWIQTRRTLNFPEELCLLLDVFKSSASSLKRLDIQITKNRLDGLGKIGSLKFCLLDDLHASLMNSAFEADSTKLRSLPLFSAPHLKKLRVSNFPFEVVSSLPVIWNQLTHLRLEKTQGPFDAWEVDCLLRKCPQLVHCSILPSRYQQRPSGHTPIHQDQVVVLHHLKYFDIDIPHPHEPATAAFAMLQLPALEDIGVFWAGLIHSPLLSLVEGCNIRTLNTAGTLFRGEELIQCLRLCPNLSVLLLGDKDSSSFATNFESDTDIDRTDAFLRMLSFPDDNGQVLCPCLEIFQISATHTEYTDQAVLAFIKAKQEGKRGISNLKSLAISFWRVQKLPMAKELSPYREQGLKLVLRYMAPSRLAASKTLGKSLATVSMPKSYHRYRRAKLDSERMQDIF